MKYFCIRYTGEDEDDPKNKFGIPENWARNMGKGKLKAFFPETLKPAKDAQKGLDPTTLQGEWYDAIYIYNKPFSSYNEAKDFAVQKLVTDDAVEREDNKREEEENAAKTGKRRRVTTEKVKLMEEYGGDDEDENGSPSHKKAMAASSPVVAPQKPVFCLELIGEKPSICNNDADDVVKTHIHTKQQPLQQAPQNEETFANRVATIVTEALMPKLEVLCRQLMTDQKPPPSSISDRVKAFQEVWPTKVTTVEEFFENDEKLNNQGMRVALIEGMCARNLAFQASYFIRDHLRPMATGSVMEKFSKAGRSKRSFMDTNLARAMLDAAEKALPNKKVKRSDLRENDREHIIRAMNSVLKNATYWEGGSKPFFNCKKKEDSSKNNAGMVEDNSSEEEENSSVTYSARKPKTPSGKTNKTHYRTPSTTISKTQSGSTNRTCHSSTTPKTSHGLAKNSRGPITPTVSSSKSIRRCLQGLGKGKAGRYVKKLERAHLAQIKALGHSSTSGDDDEDDIWRPTMFTNIEQGSDLSND